MTDIIRKELLLRLLPCLFVISSHHIANPLLLLIVRLDGRHDFSVSDVIRLFCLVHIQDLMVTLDLELSPIYLPRDHIISLLFLSILLYGAFLEALNQLLRVSQRNILLWSLTAGTIHTMVVSNTATVLNNIVGNLALRVLIQYLSRLEQMVLRLLSFDYSLQIDPSTFVLVHVGQLRLV